MQALILAAGMGTRLGKYTRNATKCMVSVDGKTLLERTFDAIRNAGIGKVIIVTGYMSDVLIDFAETVKGDLELVFINNSDYKVTNNIYSLYMASDEMKKDDTILFESDLIFDPEIVKLLISNSYPNLVTVSRFEEWMDGTVTTFDNDNNVTAFIDKKCFSWDKTSEYYKTVNIYKISRDFFVNWYSPFLEAYIKSCGYSAYYEMVLKVIANINFSELKVLDITGHRWYEIDTPQDLQTAETIFKKEQLKDLNSRFGGYWRFNNIKDFCYLVNPWFPDKRLMDELKYSFSTLLTQYPSGRKIIDNAAASCFGVDEKKILTGNGAAELIKILMQISEGNIFMTLPSFNEYMNAAENRFVTFDSSSTDYKYGMEDIFNHINDVDNIIIINPDNPSGNYIKKDEMISLIENCTELGKRIIVDESFGDFADPNQKYTLINDEILDKYPHLVVIKSISKSYGVPGLRLGIAASSDSETIKKLSSKLPIWNINSFAEYFLQILGKYQKDYIWACDRLSEERKRFSDNLSRITGLKVYPSQANFIMCKLLYGTADELAEFALTRNFLIKSLFNKQGCKNGEFIRIAIRTEQENDDLVQVISDYIDDYIENVLI